MYTSLRRKSSFRIAQAKMLPVGYRRAVLKMSPAMDRGNVMSRASRRDYGQRIYPRYERVSLGEKRRILDEFCANCERNLPNAAIAAVSINVQ